MADLSKWSSEDVPRGRHDGAWLSTVLNTLPGTKDTSQVAQEGTASMMWTMIQVQWGEARVFTESDGRLVLNDLDPSIVRRCYTFQWSGEDPWEFVHLAADDSESPIWEMKNYAQEMHFDGMMSTTRPMNLF